MARPTSALIIDDEPHVRMFLKLLLKQIGVTVIAEAGDGVSGVASVRQHKPELVILDVNLPQENGVQVLAKLGSEFPDLPVIMVSSQNATKTILETQQLGALAYILKFSPKAQVLKELTEALESLEDDESDEAEAEADGEPGTAGS
jgi:two-component system chemotaxis response regulator CheY